MNALSDGCTLTTRFLVSGVDVKATEAYRGV